MPIPPINVCPVCKTELKPGVSQCPHCDADLRLLAPEGDIAVDFYNQGLDCVETGDRRGALEKMQAAIAADPAMVDAYIVVGKLLAQTGKSSETEQAIEYWKEAKHFTPNVEQSQTIEACLNRAETLLARERQEEGSKKRKLIGAYVLGAVALAAACGVIGFLLNRPALSNKKNTPFSATPTLSNKNDGVEAVKKAINRSDIKVQRFGDKMILTGVATSEAEKSLILQRAARATKLPIDANEVKTASKIAVADKTVSAFEVETLLREKARNSDAKDPLHDAEVKVEGGGGKPLKITGYCYSDRAGMRAANLVRSVYPNADKADTSGLKLRARRAVAATVAVVAVTRKTHTGTAKRPKTPRTVKPAAPDELDVVEITAKRRALVSRRVAEARRAKAAKQKALIASKKLQSDLKRVEKRRGRKKFASSGTYKVRRGETILSIVRKFGKRDSEWKKLWLRNESVVIDPNSVPTGVTLSLPPGWRLRGER